MEKEPQKKIRINTNQVPRMVIECCVIILAAFFSYLMVFLIVNLVFHLTHISLSLLFEAVAAIVIMTPILVLFYRNQYKKTNANATELMNAIKQVANGDFNVRLDLDRRGAWTPVYEDFNKMTAELGSVQLLRNDFINNYSHEFKTPIASINGFANLLLDTNLSATEQRQYIQIIAEESSRLTNLAENTILLSKLNSQQIVPEQKEYALDAQIRQCSIILSNQWLEKNISFVCNLEPVTFYGNEEIMQRLWLNLINNAIKYTPADGNISVSLKQLGSFLEIKITDSGIGMEPSVLSHIFDPYYQAEQSHSRQGLGLGLSISKRIVDMCDGTINVTSESNVGTTFTVLLKQPIS